MRHDYTAGTGRVQSARLHGRLRGIAMRPAILEHQGGVSYRIVGYGHPVSCESTDAGAEFESDYEFVFTLETNDPLRTETWHTSGSE